MTLKEGVKKVLIASLLVVTTVTIFYLSGVRVNTSESIPLGIYKLDDSPLEIGSYVILCPNKLAVFRIAKERGYINAGFCPGGYGHLLKKILAAKNDVVSVTKNGVLVNGVLLPYSKPYLKDSHGRPLNQIKGGEFILNEHQYFLMTDQSNSSFDSRYFGPVDKEQIISVIKPLITWAKN